MSLTVTDPCRVALGVQQKCILAGDGSLRRIADAYGAHVEPTRRSRSCDLLCVVLRAVRDSRTGGCSLGLQEAAVMGQEPFYGPYGSKKRLAMETQQEPKVHLQGLTRLNREPREVFCMVFCRLHSEDFS